MSRSEFAPVSVAFFFAAVLLVMGVDSTAQADPADGALAASTTPAQASGQPVTPEQAAAATKGEIAQKRVNGVSSQIARADKTSRAKKILDSAAAACSTSLEKARYACLEHLSPIMQGAAATVSGLVTSFSSLSGTGDQCSQVASGVRFLQGALTAYNAACSTMKMLCEQRCLTAKNQAAALEAKECSIEANEKYPPHGPDTSQREMATNNCRAAAQAAAPAFVDAHAVCGDYAKNLGAAGAALGKALIDHGKAKQCQNDVADCLKNPTDARCQTKLDCSLAKNDSNPICICEKNPRAPGCAGALGAGSSAAAVNNSFAPVGKSNSSDGSTHSLATASGAVSDSFGSPSGGGGLGGGLPAGGGAGGGLSGSRAGVDGSKNSAGKASINTNVLESAGGGGGGFRPSFSGSSYDPYTQYKGYNPHGTGRGLAGQTGIAAPADVTGSNGLSNWEKVRVRYQNAKSTLIAN